MPRLKYVGDLPVTFQDTPLPNGALARVGLLMPGQEFGVPEDVAEQFLRRGDIALADEVQDASPTDDAKPAKSRSKAAADAPVADAPTEPSETADAPSPAAE